MKRGMTQVTWIAVALTGFVIAGIFALIVFEKPAQAAVNEIKKMIGAGGERGTLEVKCRQECSRACSEGGGEITVEIDGETIACSSQRGLGEDWECTC